MKKKEFIKRNIRDLSYLVNSEGLSLAPNQFIRSSALYKLSKKAKAYFLSLPLTRVLDLRTDGERAKKPDFEFALVDYRHIPVVKQETLGITHERGLKAYKEPPKMESLYAHIATDPFSVAALKEAIHYLFHGPKEGASLIHCTAGKDRAGIVTALFLTALGYDEKCIFEDYELSNKPSEKRGRQYRFWIKALLWSKRKFAQGVYEAMLASPKYLRAAFTAIENVYGNVRNYIHDALGISDEDIVAFKKAHMVPAK